MTMIRVNMKAVEIESEFLNSYISEIEDLESRLNNIKRQFANDYEERFEDIRKKIEEIETRTKAIKSFVEKSMSAYMSLEEHLRKEAEKNFEVR